MATLILDRRDLEIRLDGSALALYEPEGRRGSVPLKLLDRLILQGDIQLNTGVLTKLAESGVATLLLSKRQSRRIAVILGPTHNDASIRIAQSRRLTDTDWQTRWARQLVSHKIRGHQRLLGKALAERPDLRKPLFDAIEGLNAIQATLQTDGDIAIDSLRGHEGAAARAYFSGYTQLFAPALNFTGRNRRPPKDPVNACLSLGYTLLHFDAVRASHIAGLDPLIGFYHAPAIGRESLASDLIETLRPHLDAWIWQCFRTRDLRPEHFSDDKGACLLGKAGREIFYAGYETASQPWRRSLRRHAQTLARGLREHGGQLPAPDDNAWHDE